MIKEQNTYKEFINKTLIGLDGISFVSNYVSKVFSTGPELRSPVKTGVMMTPLSFDAPGKPKNYCYGNLLKFDEHTSQL